MHETSFFLQAIIYLSAAVIFVPLAARLGLGSVLGYLIAGIGIGPAGLGLIGQGQDLLHFAEFGVVMMLFVIGLELELPLLWKLKNWLIGLGGLQVVFTTLILFGVFYSIFGNWKEGLAIGMILSMSSTAIVLQTLNEKGLMKTQSGQGAFSVLLFQDMAVIPMLAIFPLLATYPVLVEAEKGALDSFPAWLKTVFVLLAIGSIVFLGRFALNPLFHLLAKTRLREVFTAASLLLVLLIAQLMTVVGLSPALGTFLAGVVLATSEFRHELESDLEPFKGLLLGLFFISVGASLSIEIIQKEPLQIFSLVTLILFVKILVLLVLSKIFSFSLDQSLFFALSLSQVGEFAFVLFTFSLQNGILSENIVALLVASTAISMGLTPLLLLLYEKVILPRISLVKSSLGTAPEIIEEQHPVIIAGFGKYGNMLGRFLRVNQIPMTIIDDDSERMEVLSKFGFKVYFGDPSRHQLLESAGAHKAKLIVASMDTFEKQKEVIETAKKHFPKIPILARAGDREEAYTLKDLGADFVFRETRESAVEMGKLVLRQMGKRANQAEQMAFDFLTHDEEGFEELFQHRADRKTYISLAKQRNAELERLILSETPEADKDNHGWD